MIVVANAGPLIALAQIGQLHILPALYGEIHIPLRCEMKCLRTAMNDQVQQQSAPRPGYGRITFEIELRFNCCWNAWMPAKAQPSSWLLSSRPICCSSMKPGDVVLPRHAA